MDVIPTGFKYFEESDMREIILSYIYRANMKLTKNGPFIGKSDDFPNTKKLEKSERSVG